MMIRFRSPNGVKWYAKTPTGEIAWSDASGLYEWCHDGDGRGIYRISYTGGDRQITYHGEMFLSKSKSGPHDLGFEYAITQYNEKTN